MTFGDALEAAKDGRRVTRPGWNGKGMWVALERATRTSSMTLPFLYMNTVFNESVPWLASQTDVLAEDWRVLPNPPAPDWNAQVRPGWLGRQLRRVEADVAAWPPSWRRVAGFALKGNMTNEELTERLGVGENLTHAILYDVKAEEIDDIGVSVYWMIAAWALKAINARLWPEAAPYLPGNVTNAGTGNTPC